MKVSLSLLVTLSLVVFAHNGYALDFSSSFDEEQAYDAETEAAEADAATRTAEFLREQAERERMELSFAAAKAAKALKEARYVAAISSNKIEKAESEIVLLKAGQRRERLRKVQAQKERTTTIRKLAATIKQLKTHRALLKRDQMEGAKERRALLNVKSKLIKVQKAIPAPKSIKGRPVATRALDTTVRR